jgi:hypothetical protein
MNVQQIYNRLMHLGSNKEKTRYLCSLNMTPNEKSLHKEYYDKVKIR